MARLHKGQPSQHPRPQGVRNLKKAALAFLKVSPITTVFVILDMSTFISRMLGLMTSLDGGRFSIRFASGEEKKGKKNFQNFFFSFQEQRRLLSRAHLNP